MKHFKVRELMIDLVPEGDGRVLYAQKGPQCPGGKSEICQGTKNPCTPPTKPPPCTPQKPGSVKCKPEDLKTKKPEPFQSAPRDSVDSAALLALQAQLAQTLSGIEAR